MAEVDDVLAKLLRASARRSSTLQRQVPLITGGKQEIYQVLSVVLEPSGLRVTLTS